MCGSAPTQNDPHAATLSLSKPAEDTDSTHWEACGSDNGVMTKCHYYPNICSIPQYEPPITPFYDVYQV